MDFPLILKLSSVQHNENGNIWKAKSIRALKRIPMRNVTSFHPCYTILLIKFGSRVSLCYSAAATRAAPREFGSERKTLIRHIMSHKPLTHTHGHFWQPKVHSQCLSIILTTWCSIIYNTDFRKTHGFGYQ